MVPQLQRVCDPYSVPVYSSGGFSSLTAVRQIVDSCVQDTTGPTVLLHLGDCDPSGYSIYQAVFEDVAAFVEEDRLCAEQTFTAERVAINFEQVAEFGLVADPIKTKDSRSKVWKERGYTTKVEIEALAPDAIAKLLTEAIERHLDQDIIEVIRQEQAGGRRALTGARCGQAGPGTAPQAGQAASPRRAGAALVNADRLQAAAERILRRRYPGSSVVEEADPVGDVTAAAADNNPTVSTPEQFAQLAAVG
jgi:hypothetical protein